MARITKKRAPKWGIRLFNLLANLSINSMPVTFKMIKLESQV